MKKHIIYSLLLLVPILSFAQSKVITGIVKDIDTKKAIQWVSISIEGTNQKTLTNEEGEFKIAVPDENSILNFYHISYSEKNFKVGNNENVEVLMTSKEYQLDEVVIGNESGLDSLLLAVNQSKMKLEKSLLLNTYYREFLKEGGKFTCFADGMLDYYMYKKTVGKKKKMHEVNATDLYVKQSRVCDLLDENASEEEKFSRNQTWNNINNTVLIAYSIGMVSWITNGSNDYNFKVTNKTDKDGNRIKIIKISPKEGVEKGELYVGSVTYDTKSNLILETDLKFSPEHKKYAVMQSAWFIYRFKMKFNDMARKSSFKIDGDKYVMLYDQFKMDMYIKVGRFESNFEYVYDITTLDYKEGIFDLSNIKKYDKKTLSENGNKYTERFWEKQNVIPMSDKEESIIRELNKKSASTSSESALK